jgi:hypothetical protein
MRPLPPKTIPLVRPLPPKTIPLVRRGVVFLEEDNLVVFDYFSAYGIWPHKRDSLWWEWPHKRDSLWWE